MTFMIKTIPIQKGFGGKSLQSFDIKIPQSTTYLHDVHVKSMTIM